MNLSLIGVLMLGVPAATVLRRRWVQNHSLYIASQIKINTTAHSPYLVLIILVHLFVPQSHSFVFVISRKKKKTKTSQKSQDSASQTNLKDCCSPWKKHRNYSRSSSRRRRQWASMPDGIDITFVGSWGYDDYTDDGEFFTLDITIETSDRGHP